MKFCWGLSKYENGGRTSACATQMGHPLTLSSNMLLLLVVTLKLQPQLPHSVQFNQKSNLKGSLDSQTKNIQIKYSQLV